MAYFTQWIIAFSAQFLIHTTRYVCIMNILNLTYICKWIQYKCCSQYISHIYEEILHRGLDLHNSLLYVGIVVLHQNSFWRFQLQNHHHFKVQPCWHPYFKTIFYYYYFQTPRLESGSFYCIRLTSLHPFCRGQSMVHHSQPTTVSWNYFKKCNF